MDSTCYSETLVTRLVNKDYMDVSGELRLVGRDSTSDFEGMFHSRNARAILERYRVGDLEVI